MTLLNGYCLALNECGYCVDPWKENLSFGPFVVRALGVVDGFTIWSFIIGLLESGVLHGASRSYFGPSFLVYSNLEFFMGHL